MFISQEIPVSQQKIENLKASVFNFQAKKQSAFAVTTVLFEVKKKKKKRRSSSLISKETKNSFL